MRLRFSVAFLLVVSGILWAVPGYACDYSQMLNDFPIDGATVSSTMPTLGVVTGTTPSDPCAHTYTQWLIATDPNGDNIIFDSAAQNPNEDNINLYVITVPSGYLSSGQTYYWVARQYDGNGEGFFSDATGFTVASSTSSGNSCEFAEVVNYYPEYDQTISTTTPKLEIMSDGLGCEPSYTQWVVATDAKFGNVVFDSGLASNLFSITVPSGLLSLGQSYYWTAKVYDEFEHASPYSESTKFSISEIGEPTEVLVETFDAGSTFQVVRGPVLFPGADRPVIVKYIVVNGMAIFEGDILLGRVEIDNGTPGLQSTASANEPQGIGIRSFAGNLWPAGVMPYTLDTSFSQAQRNEINQAMQMVSAASVIRFAPRSTESDYVHFQPGAGCSSYVGRIGGKQEIIVNERCGLGSTIHEILHALGVFHEQSRCDRDNFVRINFGNIEAGREGNFENQCVTGADIGSYDHGSIMHYPEFAFSSNNQATIETIPAGTPIGNRSGLSAGDIGSIQSLYGGSPISPPAGNVAPVVDLKAAQDNSGVLVFNANATDPDGDPLTYEWFLNGDKQLVFDSEVRWSDPADGTHTVMVRVNDGRGNSTQDTINFDVTPGGDPGPGPGPGPGGSKTIAQALDTNNNVRIDDPEIMKGIQYWILGEIVAGTDNLRISDGKILNLISYWILSTPIPQSTAAIPEPKANFWDWMMDILKW